jgi:hypothetical protein
MEAAMAAKRKCFSGDIGRVVAGCFRGRHSGFKVNLRAGIACHQRRKKL